MPKLNKINESDYHTLAAQRGVIYIGPFPENTNHKTWWLSPEGNHWYSTYQNVKRGRNCSHDSRRNARLTLTDYKELGRKIGMEFLGPMRDSNSIKTTWRCPQGHLRVAPYFVMQRYTYGKACMNCRGTAKKAAPEEFRTLAASKGLVWLDTGERRRGNPSKWRCIHGREFYAAFRVIKLNASSCPCEKPNSRKLPFDYYVLAAKRHISWLGPIVGNTTLLTGWKCSLASCGHVWQAPYSSIYLGTNCPRCANNLPHPPADYHQLAAVCGLDWLGPYCPNAHLSTKWRCWKTGHIFSINFNNLDQRRRCPMCFGFIDGARVSQPQRQIATMLPGSILNHRAQNFRIDIALIEGIVKIAIEYDSAHYHRGREVKDRKKDRWLLENNWRILHIRSNALIPTSKQLIRSLEMIRNGRKYVVITLRDWYTEHTLRDYALDS